MVGSARLLEASCRDACERWRDYHFFWLGKWRDAGGSRVVYRTVSYTRGGSQVGRGWVAGGSRVDPHPEPPGTTRNHPEPPGTTRNHTPLPGYTYITTRTTASSLPYLVH